MIPFIQNSIKYKLTYRDRGRSVIALGGTVARNRESYYKEAQENVGGGGDTYVHYLFFLSFIEI